VGAGGSAEVFAPQKGATVGQVATLDAGLRHFLGLLKNHTGHDVSRIAGGGAAGGLAAGLMAACGARVAPGAELIMDACGFDDALQESGVVITGEGSLDAQSLAGKAVIAVARRAKAAQIPAFALVGRVDLEPARARGEGLTAVFSIVPRPMSLQEALLSAAENLRLTAERLGDVLAIIL
jgi:glycerate kinase